MRGTDMNDVLGAAASLLVAWAILRYARLG